MCYLFSSVALSDTSTSVQLAKVYDTDLDVKTFLVSEKYDGIRAIWRNQELRTRNGKLIVAPDWFVDALPNLWLDGELWSKRQDFEFIASTVLKKKPNDAQWRHIKYMVFDAPNKIDPFRLRVQSYTRQLHELKLQHVWPVKQMSVGSNRALSALLARMTQHGAEGLMLHYADAMYARGRSGNLLKLKPYMDSEAEVIGIVPGKGKYLGKMGSLEVRWDKSLQKSVTFHIGSGFDDEMRASPPEVGSLVQFKYHGLTKNSIPKFASFLKVMTEN